MIYFEGYAIAKFDDGTTGNVIAAASVEIRKVSDNSLATLYAANNTGGATLSNPLTTDSNGKYAFYAVNDRYKITATKSGVTIVDSSLDDVSFFDVVDGGAQIKTAYESQPSAFTDAQFTKLAGIESGANATDSANVTAALAGQTVPGSVAFNGEFQQVRTSGNDAVRRYTLASGGIAGADDLSIDFNFLSGIASTYTWCNSNYQFATARGAGSLPGTEAAALAETDFYIDSVGNGYANTMSFVIGSGSGALSAGDEGVRVGVVNLGVIHSARNDAGVAGHHIFINPNGTVGSIQTSGTSALFNTTSDPRLKDFKELPTDAEVDEKFNALYSTFRVFDWKNGSDFGVWGFDAHACIDAGLDMGSEGEGPRYSNIGDIYKTENVKKSDGSIEKIEHKVSPAGVDQSKAVPILLAKIEQLERRLAALEA